MPPDPSHLTVDEMSPRVDFASRWRLDGGARFAFRVPSHDFLLVESGTLTGRNEGGEFRARAGDLLCLRRVPITRYGFDGAVRYWEAHCAFAPPPREAVPLWLDGRPIPELVTMGEHAAAARRAFETMCLEIDHPGDLHRARVRAAACDLIAAIAGALGRQPARPRRDDPWLRARAALAADLGRPLTLAAVARDLGLSENHFIRSFRQRFGTSPMAYRSRARMRQASVALAAGGRSVKQIAARLGFADASAFTRAFRRQFGVAPSDWRGATPLNAPTPAAGDDESPFPLNRHILPPEATTPTYPWH